MHSAGLQAGQHVAAILAGLHLGLQAGLHRQAALLGKFACGGQLLIEPPLLELTAS